MRVGSRAGYYKRGLITREGKIELRVPRDRSGEFSTALFERFPQSEKVLVSALVEMYMQGVSTPKVRTITEELCNHIFAALTICTISEGLDEAMTKFARRRLSEEYLDRLMALYCEKVTDNGTNQEVEFLIGINSEGQRQLLACFRQDCKARQFGDGPRLAGSSVTASWRAVCRGRRVESLSSTPLDGMSRFASGRIADAIYSTDFSYFVDEKGAIGLKSGPARRFAEFLGRVVAVASAPATAADCCGKQCRCSKCKGMVTAVIAPDDAIEWLCPGCGEKGRIANWRRSFWDLSEAPRGRC